MSETVTANRIKQLSDEEIQTLDVHAALRCLGENNNLISEINSDLVDAMQEELKARTLVMQLKETKRALIQQQKTLAVIASRA